MIEFYPQIKSLHVFLVLLSGALFALRGGAALLDARWPRHTVLRYGSYTIDTFLLTSVAMLATMLPRGMFANGWLAMKLAYVVVYILLGVVAMRPAIPRKTRTFCYLAALATFIGIIGIARLHHPWGWLAPHLS
ncbi:SirB2 family protein [Solilutibacter tolerans]|uniref:Uncharacterized membrane protein SirB2 n=1 Tax=Solilutibacter tolerans TaxID=1604334 RepID=A0A1N6R9W5_9GAMM|nr:SirB2 family protein [Lysobacter tolerans]SIQ25634.1 Uncharacterized membrane protein SirB2 [Lysobacter tolerans]